MIKWAYIKLVWRNNRSFAIFSMVFITLFQFLILYLISTFDTPAILSAVLEQLPPMMKAFLQDSFFSMLNYDGAAAFGFNHPIVVALLVITAINIPVHHITREIETGTLELLLAHPFRRSSFILSLWVSGCLILFLIIAAALAGSFAAIILFHHLTAGSVAGLFKIGFNLLLLILLIFSYTMLISVFARQGFKAGNLSSVVTLVFYLLSFIAQVWNVLAFTLPYNIFTYYEPQKLILNQGNFILDVVILFSLSLLCFFISLNWFGKRDIP